MRPCPAGAHHPARILIVDDERQNRAVLEAILQPEGYLLLNASNGEDALTMVAHQPPDLILLDIMMPGLNGYEVATRIKGNPATENIPVIMVTALDDRKARLLGLNAGAADFLTKPVDRAELCARVRNLLRLKAYGDHYDNYSQVLEGEVVARTADLVARTHTLEQQALALTEQAALLDLAQDAIVAQDMNNRILFWSRGAEVMYGWPSPEAMGRDAHAFLRAELSEPADRIRSTLLRQGHWEGEAIHHKRDGSRVIVASRWALQRDPGGEPVRILTINNDVSARKQADTELLLLTERLSLATPVAKVGVWDWDLASNTLTWDATMFDIYGREPVGPMPYARWASAVFPADLPEVEAALRKTVVDKGEGSAEYRIVLPDGSLRHVCAVERVVLDDRGTVTRVIGVDMDVTGRKEAALALEQVRKDQMRFKDEFLSHVSHELRSPLTAIKQFTSILLNGLAGELNKEQREYQQLVLKNSRQLQSMVDDLLEVTRMETGKLTVEPESVSVANAVAESLDTLQGVAAAKGITLSSEVSIALPSAFADQTRLRQILIILLDNALKFTPEGGAVSVRARLQHEDPRFLLFEVSDTGTGISPELAGRVFERLHQGSESIRESRKGLGLGLYICKELVTRHGGQITARSRPGKGSTFSFTLPVFSLNSLIAPLLRNDAWPAATVALVTVETSLLGVWPSREDQEEWSHEARTLLQRCLLPDLDVLLPTMNPGAVGERFFVAAFADDTGASVLSNRIRGQFDRLIHLWHSGLTVLVSYSVLRPYPQRAGASQHTVVTSMATSLEEAITSHLIPAVAFHD